MSTYQPAIGLEIHAELKTRTKMFCDSLNDPHIETPNVNVCPVCLAHPGVLPTINEKAVEEVIKVGLALGATINPVAKFDRKNYFYPDLPKGYQISQYDKPLVSGGKLCDIRIRRIHLEEDTGTLIHADGNSLVDFNRAGVPLMELVTEPDMASGTQARKFAQELQLIVRYLNVANADMEKGQMRLEANVSVRPEGTRELGTKVEIKNLNSFRYLEEAIEHEIERQTKILESGEKVVQVTMGWSTTEARTVVQRGKEEAHDYRYFPEPDLPPFETSVFDIDDMRRHLPELPEAKRARFAAQYNLSRTQVEQLVSEPAMAEFFEEAVSELSAEGGSASGGKEKGPLELLFNYLTSDLKGLMMQANVGFSDLKISREHLAHLIFLIQQGKIGSRQAKDILKKMFETGEDPEDILTSEGLETVSDAGELEKIVKEIIAENPSAVADYKKGKTASMQFLIGKAMGRLRGRGNPEVLKSIFLKKLE